MLRQVSANFVKFWQYSPFLISIIFSTNLLAATTTSTTNSLNEHSSPYLAMHGSDPVNWQLWDANILKQAKLQNKLIFISSGYFSCHWCHVMQKENYKNAATANYLNQHFINVKIDRELNPELDKTLIEFAQKSTGQAGWPQHVILTPDGYPFVAFIYLPNTSFNQTLKRITTLWQTQSKQITLLARKDIDKDAENKSKNSPTAQLTLTTPKLRQQLFRQLKQSKDDLSGGLKSTTKFPETPLLKSLLLIKQLPEDIEEWLELTLQQMQTEHLFDHINGGFYRYTIDPNWQTPHFEKMLYDNAQLAEVYLLAGQRWGNKRYITTAIETLHYMQQHLYDNNNDLYRGSQSAIDKNDLEGGDYLWDKAKLVQTLTPLEFKLIHQAWSLDQPPPYELGWHPRPIEPNDAWQKIRTKLLTKPSQIPTDSKNLLGWNGLMLSALSRAAHATKDTHYQNKAEQLAIRLSTLIQLNQPPRAISDNNQYLGEANLQDYAFIRQGLMDYQTLLNNTEFSKTIEYIDNKLQTAFYGTQGWKYDATPILPQQTGDWVMDDGPIPSPAALVSCLKPESLAVKQALLHAQALNFSSYLQTLNCIQSKPNFVE